MPLSHIVELTTVALHNGASDLFLAEDAPARFKVGGVMQESIGRPVSRGDLTEFWKLCGADPDKDSDVDAAWQMTDGPRFRVNLHKHLGRLGAVLRQIRTQIPTMETLGLPEEILTNWLNRRSGLILVTGPTTSSPSKILSSSFSRTGPASSPSGKSGSTPHPSRRACAVPCARRRTSFLWGKSAMPPPP